MNEQRAGEANRNLDGADHVLDVAGEPLRHETRITKRVERRLRALADPVQALAPRHLVIVAPTRHPRAVDDLLDTKCAIKPRAVLPGQIRRQRLERAKTATSAGSGAR